MLNFIDRNEIIDFFQLQNDLAEAFFKNFPDVTDMEWLLDFPKNGCIHLNGGTWDFSKHGKGIRFVKNDADDNKIVDINSHIHSPDLVDTWRLSQYLKHCDENQIKNTLAEMISQGILEKTSEKLYRLTKSGS